MSRRVSQGPGGALEIRFPFDRAMVDRIKRLPRRRWDAGRRVWIVPGADVVPLVDLLRHEGFAFDAATADAYRQAGGTGPLPAAERSEDRLPGLFDDPPPAPADPAPDTSGESLTVSGLNGLVRDLLQNAFPAPVWLVGEISGFNKSAHRRHVGFELVERTDGGGTASKVQAILFERTREEIERALAAAGDPFRLEDEVSVRLRVRVDLYVPWGQYRVVVEELDVAYTLGEAARRREEIVRALAADGLLDRNRSIPLPRVPLRVGLITSLGSDAYNDVLRTFHESGFAFDVVVHGARVQGHSTEPSVLNALDWFAARADLFDAVLVCRGGGSRTDLVWFDSEALGRAVARFPIPVLVGIGHEQDQSVLDAVARSCKTPTAAAAALVEAVSAAIEEIRRAGREALRRAAVRIEREGQRARARGRRLALAARARADRGRAVLDHRRDRLATASRSLLRNALERAARCRVALPRRAGLLLERGRAELAASLRSIEQGARRGTSDARRRLADRERSVAPRVLRAVKREGERIDSRARRLELVDPRRVLERGYSILRGPEGRVVVDPSMAPPGTPVVARLRHGALRLRSEGEEGDGPS